MPDLEVKSANNERYERYKIDSSVYRLFIYLFDFSYTGFELLISVWLARKLRKMKQKLVLKQTVQKKKGDIRSVLSSIIIKPCASLAYSSYILSLFSFNNF